MKLFLVLAIFGVAVSANTYDDLFQQEWKLFKVQFNKSYANPADELIRMRIFKNNKYDIAMHNIKYQTGEESYEMEINRFSDMTPEEVDEIFNGFNKENRLRAKFGETPYLPELEGEEYVPSPELRAPASINWVEKGAVAPVRDQGNCGSCYAFAAVGALEGRQYIKTKKMVVLSPQNIVDCSNSYGNKGCNGGLAQYAYNYIKDNGINKDSTYPYTAKQGTCRFNKNDIAARITGYTQVAANNEEMLKNAVAEGPVAVSIDASLKTFQQYKGGVYSDPNCSSTRLGHAVLAVGYGTDPATKKDYWLIKNSWSGSWGERGYIKIARNARNMCGVATRPIFPRV